MPLLSTPRTLDAMNSKHTGNKAGNAEVVESNTDQAWHTLFQKGGQVVHQLNGNVDEATASNKDVWLCQLRALVAKFLRWGNLVHVGCCCLDMLN